MDTNVSHSLNVKKKLWESGKLIAVLGALTAAINGYGRLLEKQELILLVVSTKVNALAEKVAFLEGRLAGLSNEKAMKEAKEIVRASTIPALVPAPVALPEAVLDETEVVITVVPDNNQPLINESLRDAAYQQVPATLGELRLFVPIIKD